MAVINFISYLLVIPILNLLVGGISLPPAAMHYSPDLGSRRGREIFVEDLVHPGFSPN
jgi:hypothetical protein